MDHFLYRDGCLHAEDVAISQIAAEVGTPFYLYSSATLLRHFKLFDDALAGMDHLICYAMKAASNQAILTLLGAAGAGMDVVSGGNIVALLPPALPRSGLYFQGLEKPAMRWLSRCAVVCANSMWKAKPSWKPSMRWQCL